MPKTLQLLFLGLLLVACAGAGQDAAPAVPSGLKATPADRSVRLEWNPNAESDLKGYLVNVTLSDGVLVSNNLVTAPASQFTVDGLSNGTTYVFKVLAEDQAGNRSAYSAAVNAVAGQPGTPPARPTGFSASAQSEQVLLTWSKNPEADLKGYTLFYGSSPTNLAQSRSLSTSALSTVVAGLANGTAYYFALEAENSTGQKSPRTDVVSAVPQANLSAPIISSYTITGYGTSTQVRQGAGGIEVTVQGQRLDTLTSARLLGAFDFNILEKTATSARLTGIVPHGLLPGPYTLLASSGAGETAVADALEITKITAAKTPQLNPSDTTGLGTPNRPFLTLTKALSVVGAGDTVLLGAGTYIAGESWPQSSTGNLNLPAPNVPAGVVIEGQSSDKGAVVLQGAGRLAASSGLIFAGSATARNLTLRDFRFALALSAGTAQARTGDLALENLAALESLEGLIVNYALNTTLESVELRNNNNGGLTAQGVRQLRVSNSRFSGNTYGIAAGTSAGLAASITLDLVEADQNTQFGMSLGSLGTDLSRTTARLNGTYGLRLLGTPSFVALRVGTVFEQNGNFQLFDARSANQGSFTATRFLLPGSDITVGAVVGPTTRGNFLSITQSGNAILFQ
jgi:chitodextrinase